VEDEQGNWSVVGNINELEDWFQHDEPDDDGENESDNGEEIQGSSPCTVVNIIIRHQKRNEDQTFLALLDTGARTSMGTLAAAKKAGLTIEKDSTSRQYRTAAGMFTTNKQTNKNSCTPSPQFK
jgi:hypothetical protein